MVTEQALASRTRTRLRAPQQRFPDRVARIISAARAWDRAGPSHAGLTPPRAGWARTFTDTAERGFLPQADLPLSE